MRLKRVGLLVAAVAALGMSAAAKAATVTVDLSFDVQAPKVDVNYKLGGTSSSTWTGQFHFTVDNPYGNQWLVGASGETLNTWCIELGQFVTGYSVPYELLSSEPHFDFDPYEAPLTAQAATRLIALVNLVNVDEIDTDNEKAAFQMAVWDLVNDDDFSLSLVTGNFTASTSNTTINTLAQGYLDQVKVNPTAFGKWAIVQLHSPVGTEEARQDQIIVVPVPLPAAAWMGVSMMGAMGVFGFLRKKARS